MVPKSSTLSELTSKNFATVSIKESADKSLPLDADPARKPCNSAGLPTKLALIKAWEISS
jgi:hypothetical protein